MDQFFSRPEIQSALVPFVIALVAYLGLRKINALAWIWALLAAFVAAAVLINGFTFTPLTGTRKIILLITASLPLAALLPAVVSGPRLQRGITGGLCLLALLWVFWTVITRMQPGELALFAAGGIGLTLTLTLLFDRIAANPAQLQGAGLSLLLGVGLSAMAAASALLGQLTLALASACGGAFLGWVICGNPGGRVGTRASITTLPYVLAPVLLGIAAVTFARLPWYALIPLAIIPLAVSLVPLKFESRFPRAVLASLPGLVIAIAVALWVWQTSGSDSGY